MASITPFGTAIKAGNAGIRLVRKSSIVKWISPKKVESVSVSGKGTGKEYKNYKDVEYTGTTKVNGEVRDISRRVFQRLDIDYKRIDPDSGMTYFQLMKKGRAPIWKDGTVIELHDLIQREPGAMVEFLRVCMMNIIKFCMVWWSMVGALEMTLY